MPSRSALLASDPDVEAAGQLVLAETRSAIASVVHSYFYAAGLFPGVLLSPVVFVTATGGGDARIFDGRLRQPGLGARRPRGFLPNQEIPDAAKLATPVGTQAALVALAYDKSLTPSAAVKAGVVVARKAGARRRMRVMERIAAAGVSAFSESVVAHPLLAVGAASQGGMLTLSDLRQVCAVDQPATLLAKRGEEFEMGAQWQLGNFAKEKGRSVALVVCAADAHGRFAGFFCRQAMKGIAIDELELLAPFAAVPVIRSVTRVTPGSALACDLPLCVRLDSDGAPREVETLTVPHYAVRQERGKRTTKISRPR
ncbi:MAG TPA: hypothetical protein VL137_02110 [Polyangiaceae bacterium]|jgi:gamma-glutamyltranspeptidase/glutathione hydrolase|nr:hypothetical protein [Polyangiaceae bacterium]